ncbi:unnamed protein product [Oppiella nova]|uniref:6-phosphogluconate dehydrogenase NADP-binding domain-containing protein n=1 Tax=Oppiella nova TaxID=334625 RepID=A0A7R9Q8M6_9ACAR|nr:unnamed protein product [Oppiella nova]CAG2157826.1 unnamed protein product [Oppiella nova]
MSFALLRELVSVAQQIKKDRSIRVVILTGEANVFSAGMQLALAADIRIAHPETKMSIMESRWGLVPDMGLTRSIKGVIGIDLAKELTLTARIFDGNYAKDIGLVTHVDDSPLAKAQAIAEEMLQRSPDALMAAKRVLDAMEHQPQKSLRLEKIWQLKLLLGMGLMGSRMATRLIQAGLHVAVWNRTASACDALIDLGAHPLQLENIAKYPIILSCLADDKAVQLVYEHIEPYLQAKQVIVDFSSLSVDKTKQLAESATTKQVIWIDSPVSGGTAGAENGTLVIFAGGNAEKFLWLNMHLGNYKAIKTTDLLSRI